MTEITWEQLTADEREALQYLGGYCEKDLCTDEAFEQLTNKGLAFVSQDNGYYGLDYGISPAGRAVIAQKPTEKTVKLKTVSADGLYYEVLYTDGTWEGEEVNREQ